MSTQYLHLTSEQIKEKLLTANEIHFSFANKKIFFVDLYFKDKRKKQQPFDFVCLDDADKERVEMMLMMFRDYGGISKMHELFYL